MGQENYGALEEVHIAPIALQFEPEGLRPSPEVGGGFFGCCLAAHLGRLGNSVAVIEREEDLLARASYRNQARIEPRLVISSLTILSLGVQVIFSSFFLSMLGLTKSERQ